MTRARKPTEIINLERSIFVPGQPSLGLGLDIRDSNSGYNPCNRARIESNRHTVPGPSKGVIGLHRDL